MDNQPFMMLAMFAGAAIAIWKGPLPVASFFKYAAIIATVCFGLYLLKHPIPPTMTPEMVALMIPTFAFLFTVATGFGYVAVRLCSRARSYLTGSS